MGEVSIIGLDLAKSVFQVHGNDAAGVKQYSRKLRRSQLLEFFSGQPRCVVAMEACGSAHHWGRELLKLGFEVKLIPAQYVKAFVKRQKNDAADAEAICEAAVRPNIKPVAVKGVDQQALSVLFRVREGLVREWTAQVNALRGHLREFGIAASTGRKGQRTLMEQVRAEVSSLPHLAADVLRLLCDHLDELQQKIDRLDKEVRREAAKSGAQMLQTIPGVGPVTALAFKAMGADPHLFKSARDYAAWLGLVPKQNSSGGKTKLGHITKAGNPALRRLLVSAAGSWMLSARRRPGWCGPVRELPTWLTRLKETKSWLDASVAAANKMARIIWAMQVRGSVYRAELAG